MLKQIILAAGLCTLALPAAPALAQDGAQANQCRASAQANGSETGFKDNVRTAREKGSSSATGRRRGGVRVAMGDVNGDGATEAPRMKCQNNLKQLGTAATGQ